MRARHVVTYEGGKLPECLNCGKRIRFYFPVEVAIWVKESRKFMRLHGACKKRQGK
jgi:hypothetical protein